MTQPVTVTITTNRAMVRPHQLMAKPAVRPISRLATTVMAPSPAMKLLMVSR